jgi:putative ABC transport system substrate-binding protein
MPSSLGAIALALLLAFPAVAAAALGTDPRVALVSTSSIGPFADASAAIVKGLRAGAVQPEILTFDLEGDQRNGPAVLGRLRAAAPTIVITIGSLATSVVLAEPWEIPVVFSMVLHPELSGFRPRTRAVTGATLDIPLDRQFATLRRLLPEAKRVGVLFNRSETGGILDASAPIAQKHGFTLRSREVEDPTKAVALLGELMQDVDVIWNVADSHVFTPQTTSSLILDSLRRGIPMLGLSVAHVRTGTLAALYCDYRDVGAQSAELALRVLRGEDARQIAPTAPRKVALALNLRTAQHLGLKIAPEVEREATEVVR